MKYDIETRRRRRESRGLGLLLGYGSSFNDLPSE